MDNRWNTPKLASLYTKEKVQTAIHRWIQAKRDREELEEYIDMALGLGYLAPQDFTRMSQEGAQIVYSDAPDNEHSDPEGYILYGIRTREEELRERGAMIRAHTTSLPHYSKAEIAAMSRQAVNASLRVNILRLMSTTIEAHSGPVVAQKLTQSGYKTDAKNFLANVTATLHDMQKRGEVARTEDGWVLTVTGIETFKRFQKRLKDEKRAERARLQEIQKQVKDAKIAWQAKSKTPSGPIEINE
jgi:hypothetical protein